MLEIKVDDALVKGYVAEAIFKQMTQEKRDEILKAAVASLLTPPKPDGYSGRQQMSPLQEAYESAVGQVTRQLIREDLEKNAEFKTKLQKLYEEAFFKVFEVGEVREKIVNNIANAMSNTLSNLHKGY